MLGIPFIFPCNVSFDTKVGGYLEGKDLIKGSFTTAKPTVLGYRESQQTSDADAILMGCQDGSVYALFQSTSLPIPQQVQGEQRRRRPKSPQLLSPRLPTSPVSGSLGLSLSRAKVVSGVTAEKIEAPKNYVDFDAEADKLKDILQGKNPKEKHYGSDTASIVSGASRAPSIAESLAASKRDSPTRSTLSIEVDTESRIRSVVSRPYSLEQSAHIQPFRLAYHVIPTGIESKGAARAILFLEDNSFSVLHERGQVSIYSVKDGSCAASVSATAEQPGDAVTWNWCYLKVTSSEEETFLLAIATVLNGGISGNIDDSLERCQTVAFKVINTPHGVELDLLGRVELDGLASSIGVYRILEESLLIHYVDIRGHLILQEIHHTRRTPLPPPLSQTPESDHMASLALPKSLKAMVSRSSEHIDTSALPPTNLDRLTMGELCDVGPLHQNSSAVGFSTFRSGMDLYVLVWTQQEITVALYDGSSCRILARSQMPRIGNAKWFNHETYALAFHDRIELYHLKLSDADGDTPSSHEDNASKPLYYPNLVKTIIFGEHQALAFHTSSGCIVARLNREKRRVLELHQTHVVNVGLPAVLLWESSAKEPAHVVQTAALPVELELIIHGYSDGRLRQFSLEQLSTRDSLEKLPPDIKTSHGPLSGYLMGLHIVQNARTREKYIIGGADDGSIAFWNLSTLELCARWTAFSTPLLRVIDFEEETSALLHGCVLCIAADGTLAVIVVDGFQFLYLVPGSPFPLTRLAVQGANLLLVYGTQLARVWDLHAKEFHRSMTLIKAEEMLKEGLWTTIILDSHVVAPHCEWAPISTTHVGRDVVATLSLSLEQFVSNAIAITRTISTNKDEVRNILRTFSRLRLLLSMLLTPGLSSDVDSICAGKLRSTPSPVGVGLPSLASTTIYSTKRPHEIWCISGSVSALRLVAIVYVLRALSLFEESAEAANAVIAFYTTSLPLCIGEKYEAPSLTYLAQMWFDASLELRQAIRVVFDSTLSRLSDQQVIAIAEEWQSYVPFAQPDSERNSPKTALALFLCGFIASERFSLLSVNALTDISKSVAMCFHDDHSTHRVLAIELCSKGFTVWQQYVDTLDILRSLFMLATTTKKSSISIQNVGVQARSAVLSIAAQNTALFMSTLCLDVLDPQSMEHRRSVMQILAFLIRKRPLILQPHLPRLMEAVVKSLDPNSKGDREAILGAATEIIGNVVKTYPTVDFHMAAQRLAVGTTEGAVIMYDLKTAIRLYVLEGHRHPLTALSFSPDGRRLVTVSLSDQHVMVWKVGGGFSSFFTPGLPPRQGSGGSDPFKTFPFHLGNDVDLGDSLDAVSFEWSGDRSVKVKMGESVLTFST